ncbi:MAG: multicopper oxidase domain-containing protein [Methylomonas sp.]|nr:multicopper oxidase domain-containing protein [Methylomonas sp.]PPD19471.1 MAG: copper oxidase [Methylomonas sp.]PPD25202.1 MAG: copper oxidase [Methylomonas sp.]PPD34864.1 MAG: copper oxidase [Methylomonas sp.]PPD38033.1 MAG: copper oxidase [Methylomonas sp.]
MHKNVLPLLCGALLLPMATLATAAVDKRPPTRSVSLGAVEEVCSEFTDPKWRDAQVIEGVEIQESRVCNPDNPADIAAFVKGTNNISMATLMQTQLAADAITVGKDMDGDGDPDHYIIKLEIAELNGHSPDMREPTTTFDIAPGLRPTFWVYAPKTRDMSTLSLYEPIANAYLRAPSPVIRVEQGDVVWLVLENSHYLPHSIHLHGIDHPYMDHSGEGNDGVGQTGQMDVLPGNSKTYVIKPRQPGTMYYHCHVQPHVHIPMGLQGIFVVEENRPNNWVQVFNVGGGQVRHPSVAVTEKYAAEYDLHYQSADKELHLMARSATDPRIIARRLNQEHDITEATQDYFMLNGRSFPYTLRESLIVMEENKKVKLRVLNGHEDTFALHVHGHKPMVTHYDGVDNGAGSYIKRDVHGMAPAQRLDLELSGVDDGLNSYGQGVWMFHDHVEKSFTTDGIGEGGDISLVVYKGFLNDKGIPELHGMSLAPYFTKEFWQGKIPAWQDYDAWKSLGLPEISKTKLKAFVPQPVQQAASAKNAADPNAVAAAEQPSFLGKLLTGFILGLGLYVAYLKRDKILALVGK